jgi:hypothetical protein
MNKIEKAIIDSIADKYQDDKILVNQLISASVSKREYTGVGFFLHFKVPSEMEKMNKMERFTLDGPQLSLESLEHGAGSVLFIENGEIDFLECYTYDEPWPESIETFNVYY